MNTQKYASLHNHTDYSNLKLIDSINDTEKLIDYAYNLGIKALAITDHDCLTAHVKAIKYFKKNYTDKDFKLILGNEIYITKEGLGPDNHNVGEKFYHCILLAKDAIGHRQLRELSSRAWDRSYNKNAMIRTPTYLSDLTEVISKDPGHLICSTACLGSYPGIFFLNKNENWENRIDGYLNFMTNLFKDDFYIELQPSLTEDQVTYNTFLIKKYWNTHKFIITTDSHYLSKDERALHKSFLESKSGNREVDAFYASTYVMSVREIVEYMGTYISNEKLKVMFDNTLTIADACEFYDLTKPQVIPKIEYEWDKRSESAYASFIREYKTLGDYPNLQKFFGDSAIPSNKYLGHLIAEGYYKKITKNHKAVFDRLEIELYHIDSISQKLNIHLSDYFITINKVIELIWTEADSLVGVGRGSAVGFLTNYLIDITQVNSLEQEMELPYWRFMHESRPELPDIDFDTEGLKRGKIFSVVNKYFNSIQGEALNVCTIGTLKTKSAIKTAAKGLEVDDITANYLSSLVPSERGLDWTLDQCYFGDDEHTKIENFVKEMKNEPELWKLSKRIEGLVTNLSVHAAGVIIFNETITDSNSIMKTKEGIKVTAWDLHDSEDIGSIKYDFLTVQALDKIRTCLNLLLEDKRIEWQGDLKSTYEKYIGVENLERDNERMWKFASNGHILELFQYDTPIGGRAIKLITPTTVKDLTISNSIMRLQSDKESKEQPLDTYIRFKNDIQQWYDELIFYSITPEDTKILEKHLLFTYGVGSSQEIVMRMVMDEDITNFSIEEANFLRKGIAKKDPKTIEKAKDLFFTKGKVNKTNQTLLDYVWKIQIARQLGYSFSELHTLAYSMVALQQINLAYTYPVVYWNCACLSISAKAIDDNDYEFLIEEGIIEIEEADPDEKKKSSVMEYDKIAMAVSKFKEINIRLPDINISKKGFVPDATTDTIFFGLKGVVRIGDELIDEIIARRPFNSLNEFLFKMNGGSKKLISKDKIINLIKAGCFDDVENIPRESIMELFLNTLVSKREKVDLRNFLKLLRYDLVPDELKFERFVYIFTREVKKNKKHSFYILNEKLQEIYKKYKMDDNIPLIQIGNDITIDSKKWDAVYESIKPKIRKWTTENSEDLAEEIYNIEYALEKDKYAKGRIYDWELDALNMLYSGHPLQDIKLPKEFSTIEEAKDTVIVSYWKIKGKDVPKFKLYSIIGTVLFSDSKKNFVLIHTLEGVIKLQIYKQQFTKYDKPAYRDDDTTQESFFTKGTNLMITGVMRDDVFIPKVYKGTPQPPIVKIVLDDKYQFLTFEEKL